MFTLTFGDDELTIKVLNQYPIVDKMRNECGIELPEINYWVWQTYPERSYGKFLVAESDIAQLYDMSGGVSPAKCTLAITDFNVTTTFIDISVRSITSYAMALEDSASIDGHRLMAVELEMERLWYDDEISSVKEGICGSQTPLARTFSTWNELTQYLFRDSLELGELTAPSEFNEKILYNQVSPSYLAASLASMQGYVAFPSNKTYGAELGTTSTEFTRTNLNSQKYNLIFVEHGTIPYRINLNIRLLTTNYRTGSIAVISDDDKIYSNTPTGPFYRSNNLRNDQAIQFLYPWELLDQSSMYDPFTFMSSFIKDNILKKLSTNFHIICKGVYDGSLNHTLNYLKYAYTRTGMITELKSKPFKILTFPFVDGYVDDKREYVYIATLINHMSLGAALADIRHVLNPVTVLFNDYPVFDPLNLVSGYCAGTKCYVYRTLDDEFVIISGPCNPNSPCTPSPDPTGACNYYDPETGLACAITTEATCNALGGTWTSGGTCP